MYNYLRSKTVTLSEAALSFFTSDHWQSGEKPEVNCYTLLRHVTTEVVRGLWEKTTDMMAGSDVKAFGVKVRPCEAGLRHDLVVSSVDLVVSSVDLVVSCVDLEVSSIWERVRKTKTKIKQELCD